MFFWSMPLSIEGSMRRRKTNIFGTNLATTATTPASPPHPGSRRPAATAPDERRGLSWADCRSATTRNAPSTTASAPARILARHRPECESTFLAGFETQTGTRRTDRPAVSPDTTGPASRRPCVHRRPRSPPEPASRGVIWITVVVLSFILLASGLRFGGVFETCSNDRLVVDRLSQAISRPLDEALHNSSRWGERDHHIYGY